MKRFKIDPRLIAAITAGTLVILPLAACTTPQETSKATEQTQTVTETTPALTSEEAFTGKDLEVGYDESEAETITLNGSSAVSSSHVSS